MKIRQNISTVILQNVENIYSRPTLKITQKHFYSHPSKCCQRNRATVHKSVGSYSHGKRGHSHCHLRSVPPFPIGIPSLETIRFPVGFQFPFPRSSLMYMYTVPVALASNFFQSCPWVGSTHGLGWLGLGRVGSRFFDFWLVGLGWVHNSKSAKILKGLCQCI